MQTSTRLFVLAFSLAVYSTLTVAAHGDETIRIFTLVHAEAEAMTNLIDSLSDGKIKLATDARTNSIVMVGDEEQAKVIEALLVKLDQEVEDHDDDHGEEEEEEEEHGWKEREETERRELQLMEDRERKNHVESLGYEIRRLELKMKMTKAEIEHRSKIMELELEGAMIVAKTMSAQLEEAKRAGSRGDSKASPTHVELRVRELDVKRKKLQLEFFKIQSPMKVRELELEIGKRHRELEEFTGRNEEHDHDRGNRDRQGDDDTKRERGRDNRRRNERRERALDRDQAGIVPSSPGEMADSQVTATPMFSGPQVGEKILPFEAKLVFGEDAGETITVFAEEEKSPQLLVFVHQFTRPAIGLSRILFDYAATLESKGLRSNVVFLSDDRTEMEATLQRARHALPKNVAPLVSVNGIEGPGAYGLNRNVGVTVLVCNEGKVTANFALGQPSINVDAPKIGHALVRAVGGDEKPSLEDMGFSGRGMRRRMSDTSNPEHEAKYRSMMAPLIQKNATIAEVMESAANIEAFAQEHVWFKQRVAKAASLIVNGGKLSNYGTPAAQDYLKQWAEK